MPKRAESRAEAANDSLANLKFPFDYATGRFNSRVGHGRGVVIDPPQKKKNWELDANQSTPWMLTVALRDQIGLGAQKLRLAQVVDKEAEIATKEATFEGSMAVDSDGAGRALNHKNRTMPASSNAVS